jgi:fumarylacetoacetase
MGAVGARSEAERHIFGVVILNDWSDRDIQARSAVARAATGHGRPRAQDPQPLPYLGMKDPWGLDVDLSVQWTGQEVSRPPYREMYWSPAQMLAHLTLNGALSRTGDLYASGTISGPARDTRGAFIELTWGGADPVTVNGRQRTFLEDGDES